MPFKFLPRLDALQVFDASLLGTRVISNMIAFLDIVGPRQAAKTIPSIVLLPLLVQYHGRREERSRKGPKKEDADTRKGAETCQCGQSRTRRDGKRDEIGETRDGNTRSCSCQTFRAALHEGFVGFALARPLPFTIEGVGNHECIIDANSK